MLDITEQTAITRRVSSDPAEELGVGPLKGFRADVQALRGLAVLMVVLYHAQIVLPGGFVGVDVFFVISGFVIGRLLLGEFGATDAMSFARFYVRRARRLLPALGLMLALVVLAAPLLAPIGAEPVTSRTGIAAALFSANAYLYTATAGGYFEAAAGLNPLLHTWSLSVEEQFYFVIPALLFLAWRVGRRWGRPLLASRVFVFVVIAWSFVACVALSFSGDVIRSNSLRFAFFSPFTRAWEFAAGLALVVLPVGWLWRSTLLRRAGVVLGLALIGAAALLFSDLTLFPGVAALLPVLGTALVIHAGTTATATDATGSDRSVLRPMIWLGDMSYSWYLWHWPLIVFAGAFWPQAGVVPLVVAAGVSLLPAWWSYRALEQRLRSTPTTSTRRTLLLAGCCIAAPLAAAALARPLTSAVAERTEVAVFAEGRDRHVDGEIGCDQTTQPGDGQSNECTWGDADASTSVVLVGDSMAGQFSEALIGGAEQAGDTSLRITTRSACPLNDIVLVDRNGTSSSDECRNFVVDSLAALEASSPDVVVVAGATDFYVGDGRWDLIDPATGEVAGWDERGAVYEAGLVRVVERLEKAGSRVVVVNVIPKYDRAGTRPTARAWPS